MNQAKGNAAKYIMGLDGRWVGVSRRIVRYNLLGKLKGAQILLIKGGNMPAEVGDVAPDFKLPSPDGDVSLSDYKGKKVVVLSFHVFDFTSG